MLQPRRPLRPRLRAGPLQSARQARAAALAQNRISRIRTKAKRTPKLNSKCSSISTRASSSKRSNSSANPDPGAAPLEPAPAR